MVRRVITGLLLLALAACFRVGDGNNNNNNNDGGVIDDPACDAVNMTDAGPSIVECNPATGGGCDQSQPLLSCVWNPATDNGDCRCSSDRKALGEACSEANQNCEAGTACLFLRDDPQPVCHKVCNFRTQEGCEALASGNEAFACLPLQGPQGGRTENFGVCINVGISCDPLNDQCPAGQACAIIGRTPTCQEAGNAQIGEQCDQNGCAKGGLCLVLVNSDGTPIPATCYEPCMVNAQTCSQNVCRDVGLSVGLCL